MLLWILAILLIILLVLEIFFFKKNILEPSIIFTFSFALLSVMALMFADQWELELHRNTFFVIGGGVLEFLIVSLIVKALVKISQSKNRIKKKEVREEINYKKEIVISKRIKVAVLAAIIVSGLIYLYFVIKASGVSINGLFDIPKAISAFDATTKFSESDFNLDLPFLVTNLHVVIIGLGYWFACLIAHNLSCTKKVKLIDAMILLACFITSVLGGSRGHVFFIAIVGITYYLVFNAKKHNFKNVLNSKFIKRILIITFLLLAVFIPMARMLGRDVKEGPIEYISIYCGAQVKNLDMYLQEHDPEETSELFGEQTFMSLYRTVGRRFDIERYIYKSDIPFRIINGHNLGNVYTTFYAYIHDFGYVGVSIMVLIMAIISQLAYELVRICKVNRYPSILVMCYGLVVNSLFLSFFSEKFFAGINMATFRYIAVWIVCNLIIKVVNIHKTGQVILDE